MDATSTPRARVEAAASKRGLPVADVVAQFDYWGCNESDIADVADRWDVAMVEAHAQLLAGEVVEDRQRERAAAVAESIAERAAIILESGAETTPEAALRAAVRCVQCRDCLHLKPDRTSPLAGIGACAVNGWPQDEALAVEQGVCELADQLEVQAP